MPKQKSHKGLMKRIRITGTGKVKMMRAGGRHLRSHRTKKLQNSFSKAIYTTWPDIFRFRRGCLTKIHSPGAVAEQRRQAAAAHPELKRD